MKILTFMFVTSVVFAGDNLHVEGPPIDAGNSIQIYLQYDDGTISWLTWAGTYRGTWFNTEDFIPGLTGFLCDFTEYWMYHSTNADPWDVSEFYAELWSGDYTGPQMQLDRQTLTALHYSPVFAYYNPAIPVDPNFWGLENTEMSSGGWPSILCDGSNPTYIHSFYSDDFVIWTPSLGDFFIRAEGSTVSALKSVSWGSIKAVF